MRRLKRYLRAEEGMTLIELLIAMVVMSIGIAAIVAGFSSGILSVDRANGRVDRRHARRPADGVYRQGSFASVPPSLAAPPDRLGRSQYWMQVDVSWSCASAPSTRTDAAELLAPRLRAVRSSS